MSKSFEQVKREEKEAEERKRNLDTFPDPKEVGKGYHFNLLDIFDSLSPEEIKQVTLETVIKMVEEYQKKIDIEMGISV